MSTVILWVDVPATDTHLTGPDLRVADPDREQPGYLGVELRFVGH